MVAVRVQAVGILKVCVVHPQLGGLVVHHLDKGVLRARHGDGNLIGGVVCGVDEHDVEQVLEGRGAPGLIARDHGVLGKLGLGERAYLVERRSALERNDSRHDLRDRGHVDLIVWVLLV